MASLPSGTVAFLFTDVEGSTRLIQHHPDAMREALERHKTVVQQTVGSHRGKVFQALGDGFCCAFEAPRDALDAGLATQRALHGESWGAIGALRVRIGLHVGTAEVRDGEYVSSLTLARTQRVTSAGHGGQLLLSAAAAEALARDLPAGTTLRSLGAHKLRGLTEAEDIHQLVAADLPSEFPPLRVEDAGSTSPTLLQQLVRSRLVGRNSESQQLKGHWADAQQARGQLVLLSGEPGVGKTRLASDLLAHTRASGAAVLKGGCYEYEATTPYLPFVEAFRDWVHWQAAEPLRVALGSCAAEIAKFAPEIETKLGPLTPNAALSPVEERLRLFDHTARFLQSLAAHRGLLLFIDDVHWADQGTLSLLHYLLRHLRNDRVLVLAAYREIELDRAHPLAAALVEWNRERLATRIPLGRLSRADTRALLAAMFDQDDVSEEFSGALYRETEGNPFFIEEVVKSLIEQGEIYREEGRWARKETHELAIPQSVKEAIGRRLSRLSEATSDVLRTAAALGKIFPFRELAAVSSVNEDALLDALDEASSAQLIRAIRGDAESAASDGEGFAFTHDKIREVLYEELNPIRRRRLHQRIGETLEKIYPSATSAWGGEATLGRDDHAQDLAYHFAQAGDLERALRYSRRAAENASRVFAHDEALKFLQQARESAEVLELNEELAAIDEAIGDIHEERGVIQPAVESYERALARAETPAARAELKTKLGNAYSPLGDPRGLAYLEEAAAELAPDTQQNALALTYALIGRYYHYRAQHRKAIEYLERGRALAEPAGALGPLRYIYPFLAGAYQHLVLYEESDRWARAEVELGERENSPAELASGYEFLAENAAGRGLWKAAIDYAKRDEEEGRKSGSLARVAWSGFCITQALHATGQLIAARDATLAALALSDQIGEERLATWLDPMASIIFADLGDEPNSLMHGERALERTRKIDQLVLSAWALHALGYSALQRNDVPQALQRYERYLVLTRDTENAVARNLIGGRAAEAFFRAGKIEEAEALVGQALALAEFAKAPHCLALARRVHGQIFAARGDYDEALGCYTDAIATFETTESLLERSRALRCRASLHILRGDKSAARSDAILAQQAFATMGAVRDLASTENLLTSMS